MPTTGQLTANEDAVFYLPTTMLPQERFQAGQNLYLDRLYVRADRIVTRTRNDLQNIFSTYGISRQELMSTQRSIGNQAKTDSAPTPTEFWETVAKPQSERMQQVATARIHQCRDELTAAIEQLMCSLEHWPMIELDGSNSQHPSAEDLVRRSLVGALPKVAARLRTAVPDANIDDLGLWWQARLHRSAVVTTLSKSMLVSTSQFAANTREFEIELLDQAPWSHGDRLLQAFEIAHREIRETVTSAEHDLAFNVMSLCSA